MVSMCRIGGPIRIGVVRRDDPQHATWFCNPVKFTDERNHIRHVFDYMATNNFVELIVWKRVWQNTQVVDDVGVRLWICVYSYRTGKLVLTTTYVKNSFLNS